MARKAHRRGSSRAIVVSRPSKPMVIRQTIVKKAKHHARKHYGGSARGLFSPVRIGIATGAFALGMLDKSGINVPELPLIGKAGTLGVAAYFLSAGGRNKFLDEMATAALAVAAYELGSTGKVVGADYVAGF